MMVEVDDSYYVGEDDDDDDHTTMLGQRNIGRSLIGRKLESMW